VLDRLLPVRADNDYRGHPLALWLFVPITLATLVRSAIHVFRSDGGAQSIATIPLDTFSAAAAAALILIFALWGLAQLVLGLFYVAVLLRYRALLPRMYLLLIVEYAGRMGLGAWKPMQTLATPPGARFNLVMVGVAVLMFVASLRTRAQPAPR
jgi:hypothetical protein